MWKESILGLFLVYVQFTSTQFPPRLQIPGAILTQSVRPEASLRHQKLNSINTDFIPRQRRPPQTPTTVRDIRPVMEEQEDYPLISSTLISKFDDEVNKLSIPAITSAVRQTEDVDFQQSVPSSSEIKPKAPVSNTREQIREKSAPDFLSTRSLPVPVVRQEPRPLRLVRPALRQGLNDEEENIPRQPVRPKIRSQNLQPPFKSTPRPKSLLDEDELERKRRPTVQILRKYRTDNDDGSITWGFENEDGTFKEESLGTDCVIRGKYGYVDPDGVKREFSYEAGNKCDPSQLDEEDLEEELKPLPPSRKPPVSAGVSRQQQMQPQIQYRPQLV